MTSDARARIKKRLESWKENLLDLTFRNPLLNFRERKTRTVVIVDEYPQLVLQHLVEGRSFRFDPVPEEDEDDADDSDEKGAGEITHSAADDQPSLIEDRQGQGNLGEHPGEENERTEQRVVLERGLDLETVGGGDYGERHADGRLQTLHEDETLNSKLLKLYRRTQTELEEKGVNSLHLALGMLEWYESRSADEPRYSPLLMVPVQLERETARSGFTLTQRGDEPVLNPALREKLRREHQIDLPDLPELTDVTEVEADAVYDAVAEAIEPYGSWRLTRDIVLDMLSFHKYLMYKDLEEYEDDFVDNDLVGELCGVGDGSAVGGLPESVEQADLDEAMSPWDTRQVLDADASQQRAILAVKEGHDLVLEGPPGTGKSQTITNLIAEAMADGKSVLFVSEKMAALDVVRSRLQAVGLGDYCVELHSRKTNKNRFTNDLASSLEREEPAAPDAEKDLQKLRKRTDELREYVVALHEPHEKFGRSPYWAIGRLTEVEDRPLVGSSIAGFEEVEETEYEETLEALDDLALALEEVSPVAEHPLRGIGLERASRGTEEELSRHAESARDAVDELVREARDFCDDLGIAEPSTFGDVQLAMEGAQVVGDSPGTEQSVLENEQWNQLSSDAETLLEEGEVYSELVGDLRDIFRPEVLDEDLSATIRSLEDYLEDGFLRFFKVGYWKSRSAAREWYVPDHTPDGDEEAVEDLERAQRAGRAKQEIRARDDFGRELFGERWNGPGSDWQELRDFSEWVLEVRQYVLDEVLTAHGLEVAASGDVGDDEVERRRDQIAGLLESAKSAVREFSETADVEDAFRVQPSADQVMEDAAGALDEVADAAGEIRSWTTFVSCRNRCEDTPAERFVSAALEERVEADDLRQAFERRFLRDWLDVVMEDREVLGQFRSNLHESRIEDFQNLDVRSKQIARERARHELYDMRQRLLRKGELRNQLHYLQRQASLSRGIDPIRRILTRAGDAVQTIKPCIMMSPLSVAKYLPPEHTHFDLLVFDEASQITPEDAVGSFLRAEQVVIVGDTKQLPPTSFFSATEDLTDRDPEEVVDLDSILEEIQVAGVPSLRLKWHYRSQDEELITFSNERFYDGELRTFPSRFRDDDFLGVKFECLEDATYDGGGKSLDEARAVVNAVEEHIQNRPHLSLGVGTFGKSQQTLIQDLLEERRRANPSLEHFFQRDGEEGFFVKNLENLQGDDRDVIFISVTYGPDEDGRVRRQFGPITGSNGWRRLNVLTTRAKQQVRVFSSMRHEDIMISDNPSRGVTLMHDYLEYAATGNLRTRTRLGQGEPDSPFEEAVIEELEKRGYETVPQVGESGYRIDIGVVDPEEPGSFICGIECDGASYHSAATVRERDRLRQQVLEDRGWTILRVWSTDWFHDRRTQIERLVERIESAREEQEASHPSSVEADGGPAPAGESEGRGSGKERRENGDAPHAQGGPPSEAEKPDVGEIPVPTYRLAEPDRIRDRDKFYDNGYKYIGRVVEKIVEVESPIHEEDLKRRTMRYWGFNRLGSKIDRRISRTLGYLKVQDRVDRRDDFVWDPGMNEPPVRSRDVDGHDFDPDHISYEEAAEAVCLLLEHREPLLQDRIPTETVRLLGFRRAGSNLKRLVDRATEHLIEEGRLRPGGYGIRLAGESGSSSSERASSLGTADSADAVGSGEEGPELGWRHESLTPVQKGILQELAKAYPDQLTAQQISARLARTKVVPGKVSTSDVNSELYLSLQDWLQREDGTPPAWSLKPADE